MSDTLDFGLVTVSEEADFMWHLWAQENLTTVQLSGGPWGTH